MNRHLSTLQRIFFVSVCVLALLAWVGLAVDTAGLVQQAVAVTPTLAPASIAVAADPTPTALPARPRPTIAPDAVVYQELSEQAVQQALHPKTGRYIAAWLPNSFDEKNRRSFEANADILDEISPFWYATNARGDLRHGYDARDDELIELAHANNVLVIPSVHNIVNGVDPVPALLRNPEARSRQVRQIVDEVLTRNYDGFDIDYESLSASLREPYSAFIIELAEALHAQGKLLTVAVHAKTCDFCGLGGFQDWAVVGKYADRMRIMTYDMSWKGGSPGPVAPVYWVNDVAEYARSVVDPAKVIIGVPFYGYDWRQGGGDAKAYNWEDFDAITQAYGAERVLVETDSRGRVVQENRITYTLGGSRRVAYFATSRSLEAKIGLVQNLDLGGIAIWRLGGEDPDNWTVIREQLIEDPFESQRMVNRALPNH
ncbi:MAG: glycoside hydrolase [Roseiflexaceae bacterium]|nr:glycoside hydrolase [Roseiflexaceae bacterium]